MPFWEDKSLSEMSPAEWEALCDGCGKCCLIKLEDEDTGIIVTSDVRCRLLDGDTCACSDYPNRQSKVSDCIKLTPENVVTTSLDPDDLRLSPGGRGQGPRLVAPADLGRSRDGGGGGRVCAWPHLRRERGKAGRMGESRRRLARMGTARRDLAVSSAGRSIHYRRESRGVVSAACDAIGKTVGTDLEDRPADAARRGFLQHQAVAVPAAAGWLQRRKAEAVEQEQQPVARFRIDGDDAMRVERFAVGALLGVIEKSGGGQIRRARSAICRSPVRLGPRGSGKSSHRRSTARQGHRTGRETAAAAATAFEKLHSMMMRRYSNAEPCRPDMTIPMFSGALAKSYPRVSGESYSLAMVAELGFEKPTVMTRTRRPPRRI